MQTCLFISSMLNWRLRWNFEFFKFLRSLIGSWRIGCNKVVNSFCPTALCCTIRVKWVTLWWVSLLGSFILWWGLWICSEPPVITWWMCDCRSNCVPGTDNSLTPSWELRRASSFILVTPIMLLFSDAFSKEAPIPACSLHSEFADTLVTSRPENAFNDLIANSIFGATILSMAAKIALYILSSTVSTILFISLSILSLFFSHSLHFYW